MRLFKKKSHWITSIIVIIVFLGVYHSEDVELVKFFIAIGLIVVMWRTLYHYIKKFGVV